VIIDKYTFTLQSTYTCTATAACRTTSCAKFTNALTVAGPTVKHQLLAAALYAVYTECLERDTVALRRYYHTEHNSCSFGNRSNDIEATEYTHQELAAHTIMTQHSTYNSITIVTTSGSVVASLMTALKVYANTGSSNK
jgi:hypothetical protein